MGKIRSIYDYVPKPGVKDSNEQHIEKFIQSISPFKDVIKFDKEKSAMVPSSFGKMEKKATSDKRKMKRSATLLGPIDKVVKKQTE